MFQRLRNLLPSGTQSGTRTPQEATPQPQAEGSHSQDDQHRGGTPDSIAAALSLWVLDFDVHVFLDRIITNDLIYDLIFDACSARTLVRLLCTCRATSLAVKEYTSRAFNINRLLSRYFSDPMVFRHLQACTGTVISGSTALQFFDRSFYPESDLDIYVPMAWRLTVGRYLLEQGYRFAPNSIQHPNFEVAVSDRRVVTATARYGNLKGIAGVFTFKKERADGEELKVQIMVAVRSTIEVIFRFHSTCVMNVMTFNRAYCLYPRATLEERLSLVCTDRRGDELEVVFDKYRERGWSMLSSCTGWTIEPSFTDIPRWIDDGHTWSIPLQYDFSQPITPVNPHSASITRDPISITSWTLIPERRGRGGTMRFYHVKSSQLFYPYIMECVEMIDTPPITTLLQAAAHANVRPESHTQTDDYRYVDERFMQLCNDYYRVMF